MTRTIVTLAVTLLIALTVIAGPTVAGEPSAAPAIGVDEKLGEYVPLDIGFVDADGDSVYLRDVVNKPTILTLVYFHCPSICKPLLGAVAEVVDKTDLVPGKDYELLTVSFDEFDSPATATPIKENFVNSLDKVTERDAWRFLTGDSTSIARLTGATGFLFERQQKDFAHGTCLIVLSPDGKIVRYLYGSRFMPFDLKMAVSEATKGHTSPSIARVLRYCFSYDPAGRKYVLNVTRLAGASGILLAVGWLAYIGTFGRLKKGNKRAQNG